jgi:hypothetical protein
MIAAETINMQPWGFSYRLIPVYKSGTGFKVFGKQVETSEQAIAEIDNGYLSLQNSIK